MVSGALQSNTSTRGRFMLSPNTETQTDFFGTGMNNQPFNHFVTEAPLGDLVFNAAGANVSDMQDEPRERLRITSDYVDDPQWDNDETATRVAISGRPADDVITEPLSMLHMGDPWY